MRCYDAQGEIIMKKYFLLSLCTFCLLASAGCSKSTGVIPWGAGAYAVTATVDRTIFTSHTDAEVLAHQEAAAFCASRGQDIYVEGQISDTRQLYYFVKVLFRCIGSQKDSGTGFMPRRGETQKVDVEML